jgi:hypothetical protein
MVYRQDNLSGRITASASATDTSALGSVFPEIPSPFMTSLNIKTASRDRGSSVPPGIVPIWHPFPDFFNQSLYPFSARTNYYSQ